MHVENVSPHCLIVLWLVAAAHGTQHSHNIMPDIVLLKTLPIFSYSTATWHLTSTILFAFKKMSLEVPYEVIFYGPFSNLICAVRYFAYVKISPLFFIIINCPIRLEIFPIKFSCLVPLLGLSHNCLAKLSRFAEFCAKSQQPSVSSLRVKPRSELLAPVAFIN